MTAEVSGVKMGNDAGGEIDGVVLLRGGSCGDGDG